MSKGVQGMFLSHVYGMKRGFLKLGGLDLRVAYNRTPSGMERADENKVNKAPIIGTVELEWMHFFRVQRE